MVKNGDKVEYIGKTYQDLNRLFEKGRKGFVVSDPYQLENTSDVEFVDVDWFFEKRDPHAMLTDKPGHPVNVANLEVLK